MYLVDQNNNRITNIQEKTFSELGFKERTHLQEWIAYNSSCLGEELLIIQKEFDGFDDTRERLDLLALDKSGNLVVIENKLDDTGRDVTWQSLKYASYCSSLTKKQIREVYQQHLNKQGSQENAEDNLVKFYDDIDYEDLELNIGQSQRIIMVAGNFRKEVTSTVLWLRNYKVNVQCIKATPYKLGEQVFIDLDQIIPVKEAEDYIIKITEKAEEENSAKSELKERHNVRLEFWNVLLNELAKNNSFTLFNNISSSKDSWIGASAGVSGIAYNFAFGKNSARVELYISNVKTEFNKFVFDKLVERKENIEKALSKVLVWERLNEKKACRIKAEITGVSLYDKNHWDKIIEFMIKEMINFEKVFKEELKEIKLLVKNEKF